MFLEIDALTGRFLFADNDPRLDGGRHGEVISDVEFVPDPLHVNAGYGEWKPVLGQSKDDPGFFTDFRSRAECEAARFVPRTTDYGIV